MAVSRKLADLFYEVRARTSGFEADLKSAEKSAEKLGAYIKAHPVAAAGALGAALLGVAVQATRMAAEVEKGMKGVKQSVSGTAEEYKSLRSEIRQMSLEGPRTQVELATAASEIGRQGVKSLDELKGRLAAATRAADATGTDINTIIGGMDQVFDLFGDGIGTADEVMQKLWATARGRAPMDEFFAGLQAAAPVVNDLGLDFDTTTRAMAALLDTGRNAKQAGAEIAAYAKQGKEGAAAIRELAASATIATGATEEYNKAVDAARESTEASWQKLKNNFSATLIDLGQKILPVVTREMQGLVAILSLFNGELDRMMANPDLKQLASIGGSPERIRANAGVGKSPLRKEMYEVANRTLGRAREGTLDLGGYSVAELENMKKAIDAFTAGVEASVQAYDPLIDQITEAIAEAKKLKAEGIPDVKGKGPHIATPEEIEKQKEKQKEALKALELFAITFTRQAAEAKATVRKELDEAFATDLDKAKQAAAARVEIAKKLQRDLVAATRTQVDDIRLDYQEKIDEALKAGLPEVAKKYEKIREELVAAAAASEKMEEVLARLGIPLDKVANSSVDIRDTSKKTMEQLTQQALVIQQSVDGALQLASAFGLVDERIASSLRGVTQVVANIPRLGSAISAMQQGKAGAGLGSVLSAALPIAGGLASLVTGFMDAARRQKEAADRMHEASVAFRQSVTDRRIALTASEAERRRLDLRKQERDDLQQILQTLVDTGRFSLAGGTTAWTGPNVSRDSQRQALTDALAKSQQGDKLFGPEWIGATSRALLDAIAAFDEVARTADAAAAALERELQAKREEFANDLTIREMRSQGRNDEADALELFMRQAAEWKAAFDSGAFSEEELGRLGAQQTREREDAAEAARKRREDEARLKARDEQRRMEDLGLRITGAQNPQELEAKRREIENRREIEDAMERGAGEAEIALIRLAQAAQEAADAAMAAAQAQRDLEDLDARILRAQGKDAEADQAEFDARQRREYEDAVAGGKSPEYLAKLRAALDAERVKRAMGVTGSASEMAAAQSSARGGSSVAASNVANITIQQGDRIVGLLGSVVANTNELQIIRAALVGIRAPQITPPSLPSSFTVGAGGQVIQIRITLTQNFYGPVEGGQTGGSILGQAAAQALRDFNAGLATATSLAKLGAGDVSR